MCGARGRLLAAGFPHFPAFSKNREGKAVLKEDITLTRSGYGIQQGRS